MGSTGPQKVIIMFIEDMVWCVLLVLLEIFSNNRNSFSLYFYSVLKYTKSILGFESNFWRGNYIGQHAFSL